VQICVEHLQELDFRGKLLRVRMPGTSPIDLGVPELFMVAEGFDSNDASRLGFRNRTSPSITATAAAPWLHKPTSWRD
jgi:hypothetical protein